MLFRRFDASDAPFCAALAKDCLPEAWSEAEFAALPQNALARFFVCEEDGAIIGFCGLYLVADEGQIMEVCVSPVYRRRGIAKALLHTMMQDAISAGADWFSLEVRSQNVSAIALYTALGFVSVGLRRRYYRNPCDDAILMEKRITSVPSHL